MKILLMMMMMVGCAGAAADERVGDGDGHGALYL